MYLIECVNAYLALEGLMQKELDFGTAHAVMMLRRELSPHAAFFGEEEKKLAKEYAELDEHGELKLSDGGRFEMREGADVAEYERRRRELGMVEVEDIKPRRVGDVGTVKPAVLEALSGFLEFEDTSSTASGPPSPQGEGCCGISGGCEDERGQREGNRKEGETA